jgi:hypothetical protein
MPIRVTCPNCGNVLTAPDAAAGKRGKCPKCKSAVAIPAGIAPPAAKPSGPLPVAAVVRRAEPGGGEEFDVEVLPDDPPPRPVQPVRPAVVAPPVAAAPPPPAGNPFAVFGPPPDSAAAKLRLDDPAIDEPKRPPLHPGWQSVVGGLGALKTAGWVGLAAVGLSAFLQLTMTIESKFALYTVLGLSLIASLVSLVFHFIGLVRSLKMPPPEDGGAGRGLAQTALILTAAGVVLAPCFGLGFLGLLAVPFVLGAFLRGIGQILQDRPTTAAAARFMIASGAAIVASVVVSVVATVVVPSMVVGGGSLRTAQIIVLLLSFASAAVNLVAGLLYVSAVGHAERAVRSAIRLRGVTAGPADEGPRRGAPGRDFDDEAPTPLATRRPSGRTQPAGDDFNPFA